MTTDRCSHCGKIHANQKCPPITQASDPVAATQAILQEMGEAR